MPKVGSTVGTPEGDGVVVSNDMLKMITKVKIPKDGGGEVYKDFPSDELKFKRGGCGNCPEKNKEEKEAEEDSCEGSKIRNFRMPRCGRRGPRRGILQWLWKSYPQGLWEPI